MIKSPINLYGINSVIFSIQQVFNETIPNFISTGEGRIKPLNVEWFYTDVLTIINCWLVGIPIKKKQMSLWNSVFAGRIWTDFADHDRNSFDLQKMYDFCLTEIVFFVYQTYGQVAWILLRGATILFVQIRCGNQFVKYITNWATDYDNSKFILVSDISVERVLCAIKQFLLISAFESI